MDTKSKALLYKLRKTPDDVNELIRAHKNLVYYMLTRLGCIDNSACESAAFQGLWDAIETFDVFSNVNFSTYACCCIRNAINDCRRKIKHLNVHEEAVDFTLTTFSYNLPEYDCTRHAESVEAVQQIMLIAQEYIENMKQDSIACRVMKAWYAYRFEISETELAKLCKTSPTNVGRTQAMFRAHLSNKLKD